MKMFFFLQSEAAQERRLKSQIVILITSEFHSVTLFPVILSTAALFQTHHVWRHVTAWSVDRLSKKVRKKKSLTLNTSIFLKHWLYNVWCKQLYWNSWGDDLTDDLICPWADQIIWKHHEQ